MQNTILRIALPTPLRRLFDYLPPQLIDHNKLIPGIRVRVPFQKRTLIGMLIEVVNESIIPYEKLKPAVELLDTEPLFPVDVYQLCQWAADYYHYSLGEVLSSALPGWLRKGKMVPHVEDAKFAEIKEVDNLPLLNEEQQQAVTAINQAKNQFQTFLLDGITGSGKTEVYLQVIAEKIAAQQQVLVLVPEISLTPQTIARFRERFPVSIVALHSNLAEKQRAQAWMQARSGEAAIVIGTRSAIFTPFKKLRLIIVDEEHDHSFKQQDRFRYHARDLAIKRASMLQIPVVLGSATPSLESLLNVKRKRYAYLTLSKRAGIAQIPQYQLIDLRCAQIEEGLSASLLQAMDEHLKQDQQVLLFLNRRGFAPVFYCPQCTWIAECKRCDTRLVYHSKPLRLQCHACDSTRSIPSCCEKCGEKNLLPVGLGTQRLQQTLQKYFPDVPIFRVDRDNTRHKDAMQNLLMEIHTEKKAILLGTQMLAKGHHFPQVTLVGIVDADSGLFSTDFRAAEQMGQVLLQVAGRAGRVEKPGTVLIQTRHPSHLFLQMLIREGYRTFSAALLEEREQAFLPPYSYCALFRAEAYTAENAQHFLNVIKEWCAVAKDITVSGPIPALIAKRKGLHCLHLLITAKQRNFLQNFLKNILQEIEKLGTQKVKWTVDVDPVEV